MIKVLIFAVVIALVAIVGIAVIGIVAKAIKTMAIFMDDSFSGESGEVAGMIKKYLHQEHGLDKEHMAKELGDVAWYLALGATVIGYDLEDILRMNVEKLRARYPEGFDAQRSQHRENNDI